VPPSGDRLQSAARLDGDAVDEIPEGHFVNSIAPTIGKGPTADIGFSADSAGLVNGPTYPVGGNTLETST